MGRVRKPKLEGAEFAPLVIRGSPEDLSDWQPASENNATEYVADPVPGDNGKALERIVAYFKATEPGKWEELRLCPLQHGLDTMIFMLGGKN